MKKFFFSALLVTLPLLASAQNLLNTAFDTNGPVGELLFDQNEKGEIVYSGVVESTFSADTLLGLAKEYLYTMGKKYNAEIDDIFEGVTKVACDVELPIGQREVDAGFAGVFLKEAGTISFNLVIDIRPGKYRYTLTNFITDRWRIHGDGKDNGPSNMIHWQRVNSLTKEMNKSGKTRTKHYQEMIEQENIAYHMEHQAVMDFIEGLRTMAVIEDDF